MFEFLRNRFRDTKTFPKASTPNPRLKDESFRKEFAIELERGAHGEVNRVDAALVLRHSGDAGLSRIFAALEGAKLYSLVRDGKSLNHPLVVKHPDGYGLVALFTSPERAERTIQRFPEFAELLQMDFRDIIALLDERHGIVINPLYAVATFQITPEQVAAFREHFRDGTQSGPRD